MKPWLAHVVAIGAAVLGIMVVSALWIVFLRTIPQLDAWVAGPLVVAVPFALVVALVMWLIVRGLAARRVRWNAALVLAISAVITYVATAITCGPISCFRALPSFYVGWFLVIGSATVALIHHITINHLRRAGPTG